VQWRSTASFTGSPLFMVNNRVLSSSALGASWNQPARRPQAPHLRGWKRCLCGEATSQCEVACGRDHATDLDGILLFSAATYEVQAGELVAEGVAASPEYHMASIIMQVLMSMLFVTVCMRTCTFVKCIWPTNARCPPHVGPR
jgi:hypothetical protein